MDNQMLDEIEAEFIQGFKEHFGNPTPMIRILYLSHAL